jgi:hypothetical protein
MSHCQHEYTIYVFKKKEGGYGKVENKTCENVSRSFNHSADEERFAETPIKGYEW